jgi:hypothetical protein
MFHGRNCECKYVDHRAIRLPDRKSILPG